MWFTKYLVFMSMVIFEKKNISLFFQPSVFVGSVWNALNKLLWAGTHSDEWHSHLQIVGLYGFPFYHNREHSLSPIIIHARSASITRAMTFYETSCIPSMSSGWFSSGGWGHYALASPVHTYIAEPNNFSPICLKFSKPQPPRPLSVFSNWCHVYRDHPLACHISVNVSSYRQNCSSLECWLRNVMICPQVHIPSMQRFFQKERDGIAQPGSVWCPPGTSRCHSYVCPLLSHFTFTFIEDVFDAAAGLSLSPSDWTWLHPLLPGLFLGWQWMTEYFICYLSGPTFVLHTSLPALAHSHSIYIYRYYFLILVI